MIFTYSGTGNSEYAARALLDEGEALISIPQAVREGRWVWRCAEGERVGFVFPVYFYGLPATVLDFVRRVRFSGPVSYVYAVITCGAGIGGAGEKLRAALSVRGVRLDAVFPLTMPDNYVVLYDVTTPAEEVPILAAAGARLTEIGACIREKRPAGLPVSAAARARTALVYPLYDLRRGTAKFWSDDSCVGCGVCARRCPVQAIRLVDGRPKWVAPRCDHCMACLRCNAVQYGKRTVGKYRYKHPSLRKKG